jgi:hypothetical protein
VGGGLLGFLFAIPRALPARRTAAAREAVWYEFNRAVCRIAQDERLKLDDLQAASTELAGWT